MLAAGCEPADNYSESDAPVATAISVNQEVERISGEITLWPGFDPRSFPLAVFDGERTYLFRHPAPPPEFMTDEAAGGDIRFIEGRHDQITANSYAEIGGVLTATLLLNGFDEGAPLSDIAAVAIHEAFHVFQRTNHPDWTANEADLFVYPVEDLELLKLRRLETEALRSAFTHSDKTDCWGRQALDIRQERFAAMGDAFVAYERGTELNEGLALYVQHRAAGTLRPRIPEDGFPVDGVRQRAYATGAAYAMLLDDAAPAWREGFGARESANLDQTYRAALENSARPAERCQFSDEATLHVEENAEKDLAAFLHRRSQMKAAFDSRPGYRIEISAAEGRSLFLQGFDPLNVARLSEDEILHSRFLRLGNDDAEMEAIDQDGADIAAITKGAGPHPIFNGVVSVAISIQEAPAFNSDQGKTVIEAPGFRAEFLNARIETDDDAGKTIIRLGEN